ncbi:MAG: site-specific integrase [Desulfobacterales bacterium]|nr:site-specific integrase [Desulfobacterales bacterium]
MTMAKDKANRLPIPAEAPLHNKSNQALAVRQSEALSADYVAHLDVSQLKQLAEAASHHRKGERDRLLIQRLFDGCLRYSEAISIRPCDIVRNDTGWTLKVKGKGSKFALMAISPNLVAQLQAYAYCYKLNEYDRFFPITRSQAFRIVIQAFDCAGIPKPSRLVEKVGAVHILRHSGAIERLRQTGNPKAVQDQLRHKSALMTMCYLKVLSADESLRIQQRVEYQW